MAIAFETESLTRLHWVGIVLAAITGVEIGRAHV